MRIFLMRFVFARALVRCIANAALYHQRPRRHSHPVVVHQSRITCFVWGRDILFHTSQLAYHRTHGHYLSIQLNDINRGQRETLAMSMWHLQGWNVAILLCQLFFVFQAKEGDAECVICMRYLCKSIRAGQDACSQCLLEAIEKKVLKKNDKGQWLNPLQKPLPTCTCGEFLCPMHPCLFKILGGDANHKVIA